MRAIDFSKVERTFIKEDSFLKQDSNVPFIVVDNFPLLGLLTALRFLEWVSENPEGGIGPDGHIAYNPDATAIIFAAGESKSPVLRDAIEHPPSNKYPATVLAGMKNAGFNIIKLIEKSIRWKINVYSLSMHSVVSP